MFLDYGAGVRGVRTSGREAGGNGLAIAVLSVYSGHRLNTVCVVQLG